MIGTSNPHAVRSVAVLATLSCAMFALSGCGKEHANSQTTAAQTATPQDSSAMVADFKMGTSDSGSPTITQTKEAFNPGEAIQLSMAVQGAPSGTAVTTYWYGPANQQIGYETMIVKQGDDRLRFVLDNTRDLQNGQYHAEVWVGNHKVDERAFQVAQS